MTHPRSFMTLFFFIFTIASNGFGQTANDLLQKAVALIAEDKIDEAIESLNRSIALDPSISRAYSHLGFCLIDKQVSTKTIDCFEKAIKLDQKDFLPHFYLGTYYMMQLEKYDSALNHFLQSIDLYPVFDVSYLYSGICSLNLNKDDDAMKYIIKGLTLIQNKQSSYKGLFYFYKGLIELQSGRFDSAENDLKNSMKMIGDPKVYLLLGSLSDIQGDHSESIAYNAIILKNDMELLKSYNTKTNIGAVVFKTDRINQSNQLVVLGAAYHRIGDMDKALNRLNRALRIVENNSFALTERAYLYLHCGNLEASINDLNKSMEICPSKSKNYLLKSAAEITINPKDAPELAKNFVKLRSWKDPDSTIATIIGSLGAIKAGDKTTSTSLIDEAIKHSKKNVWPYPLLKYLRGEFDENLLNKSARTPDQKSDAQAVIGLIAVARGRKDKASEHFHWLLKQGNPRSLYFDIAMNELRKIEGRKSVDDAVAQYCSKLYKSYMNTKK
jgi:tetratricopeptide (TPR) repeat protein